VVPINGIGDAATSDQWAEARQAFATDARVCRYDRPGTGQRCAAAAGRGTDERDATRDAAVDVAAGGTPALLVAHCFGGYLTRVYADRHPDRVDALVLVGAPDPSVACWAEPASPPWPTSRWAAWPQGQERLATLSPRSVTVVVPEAGHPARVAGIGAVLAAVEDVMEAEGRTARLRSVAGGVAATAWTRAAAPAAAVAAPEGRRPGGPWHTGLRTHGGPGRTSADARDGTGAVTADRDGG